MLTLSVYDHIDILSALWVNNNYMNHVQYNDGFGKCPKNSTSPPRCHSNQVDPLVFYKKLEFWLSTHVS